MISKLISYMKKSVLFIVFFVCFSTLTLAQSYNDLFTTYRDVSTQFQNNGNNKRDNNGGTQYEVMDANKFYQKIAPQNIQIINGIYLYGGQFYSVKLKIGISGTNRNQVLVCGYWDGKMWNNSECYASSIGEYGVPDQIKRACTHQAYIQSLGTVYF